MVQTDTSSIVYVGNNSTTAPYPVPFNFFRDEDLIVVVKDVTGLEDPQILNTDYTVTGEGNPNGGAVTFTWGVPATSFVTILREIDATQLTSYEEADAFPAKSHERALDKLTMLIQQALRVTGGGGPTDLGRAFRLSEASVGINALVKRNDTVLGIDALGNAILRTSGELFGWLGQVGTAWNNTAQRLVTKAAFAGQLGVQIDNMTIYIAHSTTPGDWFPFLIGSGIIGATDGVPHLLTPPAGDLVGTQQAQTLYNKTLISPTITLPTGLTKADVGLSQADNTADLNKPVSIATGSALGLKQNRDEKAVANGYPSLDGGGKVPLAQIPDSLLGASQYQGTWNAATNTPTIPAAALGNKGWYYQVAVAGSTNIDGISSWAVGDQIISNGTAWEKIPNVSAVQSVNAKTGAVVINKTDVGLPNVDNTSDAEKNAAAVILTNHTIRGSQNTLEVRLDADVINNLPVNRLNNGTGAAPTTWWCGDGSWKQPPGTGDVNGPTGSGDGEICLYSGTTGKVIRRFSGSSGIGKFTTTGVFSTGLIVGADLSPNAITDQPNKTGIDPADRFLIVDTVSGQLRNVLGGVTTRFPTNHIAGLKISNNIADATWDIDIGSGQCRSDDNAADIVLLTGLTKRLDALWAAGTNQGGRDAGGTPGGTPISFHAYVIRNPSTGVVDVLFTQTYHFPTMPSGFTQKRRIGSFAWTGSTIYGFRNIGNWYLNVPWRLVYNAQAPASLADLPLFVPSGLRLRVDIYANTSSATAGTNANFADGDATLVVNSGAIATCRVPVAGGIGTAMISLQTDYSGQVRVASTANVTTAVWVMGFYDHRGTED